MKTIGAHIIAMSSTLLFVWGAGYSIAYAQGQPTDASNESSIQSAAYKMNLATSPYLEETAAPCDRPSDNNTEGPYRLLLQVDDNGKLPWKVRIQDGRNGYSSQSKEDPERRDLVLSNENTFPGQVILSPILNIAKAHYCYSVLEMSDSIPEVYAIAKVKATSDTTPLSIYPPESSGRPNWRSARNVLRACDNDPGNNCRVALKVSFPPGSQEKQELFRETTEQSQSVRRERLVKVLKSAVWLGVERYVGRERNGAATYSVCTESDSTDRGFRCFSHCSGVMLSPQLVLTNSHCLFLSSKIDPVSAADYQDRAILRGWVRPLAGGEYERARAPDLQTLLPVFAGVPGGEEDYAILWVDKTNIPSKDKIGFASEPSDLPPSPMVSVEPLAMDAPLTVAGFPGENRLMLSFDEDCKAISLQGPISHQCDTAPGSSGSGVYDGGLGALVGLHYNGFIFEEDNKVQCPEGKSENCYNNAVKTSAIKDSIWSLIQSAGLAKSADCEFDLDAARSPLTPVDWSMPKLRGQPELTNRIVVDAFEALPDDLKKGELC